MYNGDGNVKHCIRSPEILGNLSDQGIHEIFNNAQAKEHKACMLRSEASSACNVCYDLEQEKNSFEIVSDRIFYLRELKSVDKTVYDQIDNFELNKIDIRWTNVCNFACVYCGPEFSSKWSSELGVKTPTPPVERIQELNALILDNAHNLKHVYLAGGEPLLMKENYELLLTLQTRNPDVTLRVNTNLSKVDTKVFDILCGFRHVHWIVSVEATDVEYEYIRYGGSWSDFLDNLSIIRKLDHKISFNMLHFMLNYLSIFDCIDFLKGMGFHNNSFIVGPVTDPDYLNIRHLPAPMLNSVKSKLEEVLSKSPGYLLEDGLRNIQAHINEPFNNDISFSLQKLQQLDQRRGVDSRQVFSNFYKSLGE